MIRMLSGVRGATIERYCPFGGVETLIPWINKTGTICSLSTMNISILAGVLVITVLFKRVFCSHICPMGALLEWIGLAGRKFAIGQRRIPKRLDWMLKWLKYPLLILIIFFTVKVGELIFRDFDPYYVLFTGTKGHGILTFGIWVTLGIIVFGAFIPLSFCKYLCPMAACLAPFGRLGFVRISRNAEKCTACGSCDAACEWGIKVSESKSVAGAECSNCQDCIRKCPEPGTLTLNLWRAK
jgi:polyferredoxin